MDSSTASRPTPPARAASRTSLSLRRLAKAASGLASWSWAFCSWARNARETACQVLTFTGMGARLPMLPEIRFSRPTNLRWAGEV